MSEKTMADKIEALIETYDQEVLESEGEFYNGNLQGSGQEWQWLRTLADDEYEDEDRPEIVLEALESKDDNSAVASFLLQWVADDAVQDQVEFKVTPESTIESAHQWFEQNAETFEVPLSQMVTAKVFMSTYLPIAKEIVALN